MTMAKTEYERERTEEEIDLPEDLLRDILSRLPIKSLVRFMCVCRSWYILIQEPSFAALHLTRSMQNPCKTAITFLVKSSSLCLSNLNHDIKEKDPLAAVSILTQHVRTEPASISSCNGLLCFNEVIFLRPGSNLFVFNPITKQLLSLPKSPLQSIKVVRTNPCPYYGIGFHAETNEYKVVRINHVDVEIWTLGSSSSWRYLDKIPYHIGGKGTPPAGLFVDGALHWWMDSGHTSIVSMDMANEKFCNMEPPVRDRETEMVEWNGCLGGRDPCINIWVLKDYPRKGERKMASWTKELCIKLDPSCYRPLLMQENGTILVLVDKKLLGSYNIETGRFGFMKLIKFPSSDGHCNGWVGYSPSLVRWRQEVL